MTEKRFKCVCMAEDLVEFQDNGIYKCFNDVELEKLLNTFHEDLEREKQKYSKLQSKYSKSKAKELKILVETDNTVLLDKEEFEGYVRKHEELKRLNKRRKEKNRKYRNELKKRLREISGLKEFIAEDLSSEDKVLKGFIEEYL